MNREKETEKKELRGVRRDTEESSGAWPCLLTPYTGKCGHCRLRYRLCFIWPSAHVTCPGGTSSPLVDQVRSGSCCPGSTVPLEPMP